MLKEMPKSVEQFYFSISIEMSKIDLTRSQGTSVEGDREAPASGECTRPAQKKS